MKYIYEAGDKVLKVTGENFSNGQKVVTVEKAVSNAGGGYTVWFKETQTNLHCRNLAPAERSPNEKSDLEKLTTFRDELEGKSHHLKAQLESNDEQLLQANLAIQLIKGLS